MKKVILSFFLAAIMVVPMAGAVSLESTETNLDDNLEIRFIPEDPDSSDSSGDTEDSQDSSQPRAVPRVEPLGLYLHPLVYDEEKGDVPYYGVTRYFPPVSGQNFISQHIWLDNQQKIIDETLAAGKIPVGWYMESGYRVTNVYQPIRWEFNAYTALGVSQLITEPARNGDFTFGLKSRFEDETTPYYDFGIKGHILYRLSAGGNIVRIPIQLTVDFVDYNRPTSS